MTPLLALSTDTAYKLENTLSATLFYKGNAQILSIRLLLLLFH